MNSALVLALVGRERDALRVLFAVITERAANWEEGRPLREQAGWSEHAAFMDALAEEGWVVVGGPISDEGNFHRALLIIEAESEAEIEARLAEDPWAPMEMLRTAAIYRWTVLLGELGGVRS
jgi:uncharacterized protein